MTEEANTPLRKIRLSKGYTQEDLASAAGVSRSVIQKMEAGTAPKRQNIYRKLAEALDVSIETLRSQEALDYIEFIEEWADAYDMTPEQAWAEIKSRAEADRKRSRK